MGLLRKIMEIQLNKIVLFYYIDENVASLYWVLALFPHMMETFLHVIGDTEEVQSKII